MSQVDVIVPCYKYAHFLTECVESILTQEGVEVRVLILDDASPDDTPEVAATLAERDRRVEVRRHATNLGHIATFNEGLNWAEGEYTLLLSADDRIPPGALARAARLLDENPNVGMVYGQGVVFQTDAEIPVSPEPVQDYGWKILTGHEFLEQCCTHGTNPVCTPTAVVRTRLQQALGGYRPELPHSGDMEMWMRFAAHSSIGVLDSIQGYYRHHSTNMSAQWYRVNLADLRQRKAAFDAVFSLCSDQIEGLDRLRRTANRTLAKGALWQASNAFDRRDLPGYGEGMDLAFTLDPGLREEPACAHMLLKQRMGPIVWSIIRPFVQRTRRAWGFVSSLVRRQAPVRLHS